MADFDASKKYQEQEEIFVGYLTDELSGVELTFTV